MSHFTVKFNLYFDKGVVKQGLYICIVLQKQRQTLITQKDDPEMKRKCYHPLQTNLSWDSDNTMVRAVSYQIPEFKVFNRPGVAGAVL